GVRNAVSKLRASYITSGRVPGSRFTCVLLDFQHLLLGDVHFLSGPLGSGRAAQALKRLTLDATECVDDFDHVYWNTNGTSLVCHGARSSLTDPPRSVRRELISLGVVKLFYGTDKT